MDTIINSLISACRENGRLDIMQYAMYRKRRCQKRGDKAGAALWLKVARLAAVCLLASPDLVYKDRRPADVLSSAPGLQFNEDYSYGKERKDGFKGGSHRVKRVEIAGFTDEQGD